MNCTDLKQHLMPFADGELEPSLAAEVEKALEHCPEAREELAELQRIATLSRAAFLAPVEAVNLAGVYDGVMARIAAEARLVKGSEAERSEARSSDASREVGPWARFVAWCGEVIRFERPMVLAGAAALAVAAVVGLSLGGGAGEPGLPGHAPNPTLAGHDEGGTELKRRGAEEEVKAMGKNTAYVENLSADKGEAFVEFDKNDPEAPMVLWHLVEDEGTPAPRGL